MPLADYESYALDAEGIRHDVFHRGSGPVVIILHEIPGLSPITFTLGDKLVEKGFTVVLPLLFGKPGDFKIVRNWIRVCISREIRLLARRSGGPIADWLRALARDAKGRFGGDGVGVIGMCLTGNFALSMFADDAVIAPVSCQPSLPASIPDVSRRRDIAMSPSEIAAVKRRVGDGERILAYRFVEDQICPGARFERLRAEFGEGFVGSEIPRTKWWGRPRHCLLTLDFVDEEGHPTRAAFDEIIVFLTERLRPDAGDDPATT